MIAVPVRGKMLRLVCLIALNLLLRCASTETEHGVTRFQNANESDLAGSRLKITFYTVPLSHFVPMIPVAIELAKRGHHVSFLCEDVTWVKIGPRLEVHGIKWIQTPESDMQQKEEFVTKVMAMPYLALSVMGLPMLFTKLYLGSVVTFNDSLKFFSEHPELVPDFFVLEPFAGPCTSFYIPIILFNSTS
jgi:hypothetical protein